MTDWPSSRGAMSRPIPWRPCHAFCSRGELPMKSIHVASVLAFLGASACSVQSDLGSAGKAPPAAGTTATAPGNTAPVPGSGVGAPNPAPGQAMLRVVHGSADAPAVDVYV